MFFSSCWGQKVRKNENIMAPHDRFIAKTRHISYKTKFNDILWACKLAIDL